MRQVIIYPGEDGYWVAECPSLPGCVSQGDSKQEAMLNVQDAIAAWIHAARADGREVPDDAFQAEIVSVPEEF